LPWLTRWFGVALVAYPNLMILFKGIRADILSVFFTQFSRWINNEINIFIYSICFYCGMLIAGSSVFSLVLKGARKMKKKLQKSVFAAALFCSASFLVAPTANATLQWYWGSNPNETYTASYASPTNRAYLPLTIVAEGEEFAGASSGFPLLDGSQQWDTAGYLIDFNLGGYLGIYFGSTLIVDGIGIANLPGMTVDVPEGVYTPDSNGLTFLNYWAAGDSGHVTLLHAAALNGYRVTVGQIQPIPEPTVLALLGLGLAALRITRKPFKAQ
jgi:hypothetical protein